MSNRLFILVEKCFFFNFVLFFLVPRCSTVYAGYGRCVDISSCERLKFIAQKWPSSQNNSNNKSAEMFLIEASYNVVSVN